MEDDNGASRINIGINPDGSQNEIEIKDASPKEAEYPARGESDSNNPWVPRFRELIGKQQKNGMYAATCSPTNCTDAKQMSEVQVKQAIAAAGAVCNESELKDVRFTHQKKEDQWGRGYNLTIEFEWY